MQKSEVNFCTFWMESRVKLTIKHRLYDEMAHQRNGCLFHTLGRYRIHPLNGLRWLQCIRMLVPSPSSASAMDLKNQRRSIPAIKHLMWKRKMDPRFSRLQMIIESIGMGIRRARARPANKYQKRLQQTWKNNN
jgi:hypothetical protein